MWNMPLTCALLCYPGQEVGTPIHQLLSPPADGCPWQRASAGLGGILQADRKREEAGTEGGSCVSGPGFLR